MNDDELRDLIEQAHLIREMTATAGYQTWQTHCQRRLDAKRRELLAGLDTLEAYRYVAGWIEGAEYALDALAQLDARIARERDSRKQPAAA